jgi:hypothetical protein
MAKSAICTILAVTWIFCALDLLGTAISASESDEFKKDYAERHKYDNDPGVKKQAEIQKYINNVRKENHCGSYGGNAC